MRADLPPDESARQAALESYRILDSASERNFDDIALLASFVCKTPMSVVTLIDKERQWFKAKIGLDGTETHRDQAFCAHAIHSEEMLVVEDATKDARFADNPFVTGEPHVRFYAGAPLVTSDHFKLGTLCVIDRTPRKLEANEAAALTALSRMVITAMEYRRTAHDLATTLREVKTLTGLLPMCSYCKDIRDDEGKWNRLDDYVSSRTTAEFSHGLCPKCAKIHFPRHFKA